jgi:hypothetical protein
MCFCRSMPNRPTCTRITRTIQGVFGWLQADTVAAVWIAAAAIHREKNTVEAAAAAGLQPQRTSCQSRTHRTQNLLRTKILQHQKRTRISSRRHMTAAAGYCFQQLDHNVGSLNDVCVPFLVPFSLASLLSVGRKNPSTRTI